MPDVPRETLDLPKPRYGKGRRYNRVSGDRRVHASNTVDGVDVVRYNSLGRWFLEPTDTALPRQRVTVVQAAKYAAWVTKEGRGKVVTGVLGGSRFDYLYCRYLMLDGFLK